jgi:DNA polymerase-3 subunit delta'
MPFAAIEGQERAVNYLKRSIAQGRLGHALLFTGPEGVGKKSTALALAQALNCEHPQAQEACGVCVSCRKIMDLHHPDVQLIVPDGQFIKIDQIREQVQHQVLLNPMEGNVKVYIIDAADSMTVEAANSLLKILEEPPGFVVLVLVATQPFLLLDTIRSRCQEVRFNPVEADVLASWAAQRLELGTAEAMTLARLSGGRPAEVLRLAADEVRSLRRTVVDLLQENRKTGQWAGAAQSSWKPGMN